jgi:hypothetical protein
MIKVITLLLISGFFLACHVESHKDQNTATSPATETHAEHAEKAIELTLNHGAKWKADSTTATNIALLQNIVSNAKKENPENYLQTADALQEGLNKMVRECKMKGADHEALHIWLQQMMEIVNDFRNVPSVEIAAISLGEIENHINLFSQYFEI